MASDLRSTGGLRYLTAYLAGGKSADNRGNLMVPLGGSFVIDKLLRGKVGEEDGILRLLFWPAEIVIVTLSSWKSSHSDRSPWLENRDQPCIERVPGLPTTVPDEDGQAQTFPLSGIMSLVVGKGRILLNVSQVVGMKVSVETVPSACALERM